MTEEEKAVQRLKGQYLKPDKKPKVPKSNTELPKIKLSYFSHTGKTPNRGGAL